MASSTEAPEIDFRVKLRNSTRVQEFITFEVTPDFIETRNVNYRSIDPVHAPGQIMAYQNTNSRVFNISQVRLISRTQREAQENLNRLWLLRSWTMPQFGRSTLNEANVRAREKDAELRKSLRDLQSNNAADRAQGGGNQDISSVDINEIQRELNSNFRNVGVERRGEPPAVLLLSAYSLESAFGSKQAHHINRVPVVITNISIPYPSDVDYIPTETHGVPMPTIMSLDMTLTETHSPAEYERFSLGAFKQGRLPGF